MSERAAEYYRTIANIQSDRLDADITVPDILNGEPQLLAHQLAVGAMTSERSAFLEEYKERVYTVGSFIADCCNLEEAAFHKSHLSTITETLSKPTYKPVRGGERLLASGFSKNIALEAITPADLGKHFEPIYASIFINRNKDAITNEPIVWMHMGMDLVDANYKHVGSAQRIITLSFNGNVVSVGGIKPRQKVVNDGIQTMWSPGWQPAS